MTEQYLLNAIKNDNVTGFVVVDVTPTEAADKFIRLNYGPIFVREEVTYSMIPQWMQKLTKTRLFPQKTLLQKMSGKMCNIIHVVIYTFS